jgi:ketol-acid reductoisomerase
VGENGMDWMYSNCSTTAQRGALDWKPRFKKAVLPVFQELYEAVKSGRETGIVIRANSAPDYWEKLQAELAVMGNSDFYAYCANRVLGERATEAPSQASEDKPEKKRRCSTSV